MESLLVAKTGKEPARTTSIISFLQANRQQEIARKYRSIAALFYCVFFLISRVLFHSAYVGRI